MNVEIRRPTFARTVLGPFVEGRTYRALVYALLGLPLGVFYLVFVVTGLSLGLGLLVTLAGIPVLLLTLGACRGLAQLERTLAELLLDAPMPRVISRDEGGTVWRRLRRLLRSGTTWREVAFLIIRFVTGVASFSIAVSVIAAAGYYGLVQPFLVGFGLEGSDFGSRHIDSVGEALLLVPPGLVLLLVAPSIVLLVARLERSLAVHFLGRIPRDDLRRAIAHALARGESNGFDLLHDLELYFRPSPFLTPMKLESHLLALRDSGLISSRREGSADRYSLTAEGREALER
jgi:DNA-binding transcriptional ArsR family regulator